MFSKPVSMSTLKADFLFFYGYYFNSSVAYGLRHEAVDDEMQLTIEDVL